jgi:adenylylsulfate kinase-like enzyme
MIVVLFGQPHSGKSTLADILVNDLPNTEIIDGDRFREVFQNKDYSREGRIKNLSKACDIGYYLTKTGIKDNIIYSMVFPYEEVRNYLKSLMPEAKFFYLTYNTPRGRENFHVSDFELGEKENFTYINTDTISIEETIKLIKNELG